MPAKHYGRVPRMSLDTWRFTIGGLTASAGTSTLTWDDVEALEHRSPTELVADLHCATGQSIPGLAWAGVRASELMALEPPAAQATHVLVIARYGYAATLRLDDLRAPTTLFATHLGGAPLLPERGWPLRLVIPHLYAWKSLKWAQGIEYHDHPEPGFWEARGYHLVGDPWLEQRSAYQD